MTAVRARRYGCDIQSMYMYLRDLDGRRVEWKPDRLVSQVSRFSEHGHAVHYFHQTVWSFGSSAVGMNRVFIFWKPDNLVLWQLSGHSKILANIQGKA